MPNDSIESGSNQLTGAEAMVRMLQAYGVTHIFGLCGDTSLPFYDALVQSGSEFNHILTRDERHAAYMADAYARVTGKPGVCEGPSGGGATYILPGLVEANESSIPILAITTDVATTSSGKYPLTELDQLALFRPVTKWNAVLDDASRLPSMVRTAFRAMTTGRPGSAHLAFPIDVQKSSVEAAEIWAEKRHKVFPAERMLPEIDRICEAADILANAKSAVAICGGGPVISGAFEEIAQLAKLLDLPVATSISGQGSISETSEYAVGVVGSNGGVDSTRTVVDDADVVVFIGCRAGSVTTERWVHPSPQKTIIHIDSDPMVIGANYATEVAICADAKMALAALLNELNGRSNLVGQMGAKRASKAWQEKLHKFNSIASSNDRPIRPERVVATTMKLLDADAIVCADPGTPCPYFSAYYRLQQSGRKFISNRAHGALGFALAAGMGAHAGNPSVKTVVAMGDGSFGFCCGELETLVRHNMPITSIVFSNSTYGWIKAGQNSGFNRRYYNVDFSRTDHAAVATAFGLKAWRVEDPDELEKVLEQAFNHDGPTLVDVITQPLHEAAAPVSEWIA